MPNTMHIFVALTLLTTGVFAAIYNHQQVCNGPYVLCAAAPCEYIPGNSSYATCSCVGPYTGLNTGDTDLTCKARTESLISTFSLRNPYAPPSQYETSHGSSGWGDHGSSNNGDKVPPVYAIPCTGSNAAPWAQCNGAPCTIGRNGAVTCTCPVEAASDNFYYGDQCSKTEAGLTALCKTLRSTANAPASATRQTLPGLIEASTIGAFYGNQNQISSCL